LKHNATCHGTSLGYRKNSSPEEPVPCFCVEPSQSPCRSAPAVTPPTRSTNTLRMALSCAPTGATVRDRRLDLAVRRHASLRIVSRLDSVSTPSIKTDRSAIVKERHGIVVRVTSSRRKRRAARATLTALVGLSDSRRDTVWVRVPVSRHTQSIALSIE